MKADAVIIGAGLGGMVAACELIDRGKQVIMVDQAPPDQMGGLAKEAFGGITVVDSPLQRKRGIRDSAELAYADWLRIAEFTSQDHYPREWAKAYIESSPRDIFEWLAAKKVGFFPFIHWVERGLFHPGNSVPRFHMVWGTGFELVKQLKQYLQEKNKEKSQLKILFEHQVQDILGNMNQVEGCRGKVLKDGSEFQITAEQTIVATGGICGSIEKIRQHWPEDLGTPPAKILNGSHLFADGKFQEHLESRGVRVTHLDKHWHYAAGVHHPRPKHADHGLSLIPPRSALWLDATGERIGPIPLITSYDTRYLVEQVCAQKEKYSWQIMNWKIAQRELAVSGSEYNPKIRDKKLIGFLKSILTGNKELVSDLVENCPDFVVANDLVTLVQKMNQLNGDHKVKLEKVRGAVESYDSMIARGKKYFDDDQLRRLVHLRQYLGDRLRTSKYCPILASGAGPLIAIREHIVTRKSLGGIQTNLDSQVMDQSGKAISGLYAVGEASGFGGGGIHGKRTLEGTFLGGCLVTAIRAGRATLH